MKLYIFYDGKGTSFDQGQLERLDVGPLTSDDGIKAVVAQSLELSPFDLRDFVVDPNLKARQSADPESLNLVVRPPEEFA